MLKRNIKTNIFLSLNSFDFSFKLGQSLRYHKIDILQEIANWTRRTRHAICVTSCVRSFRELFVWARDHCYTRILSVSILGIMYSQKNCKVTHFDIVYELFIYYLRSLSTIKSLICDARVTRNIYLLYRFNCTIYYVISQYHKYSCWPSNFRYVG